MRRFTQLTNAFSKKAENHCHMVRLYTVWYNFVKMHKTMRCTPAMAAGLSETLWTIDGCFAQRYAMRHGPVGKSAEIRRLRRFFSPHFSLRFQGDFWGKPPCSILAHPQNGWISAC
jgi:hypothetical protein